MFDSEYFRTTLDADVAATDATSAVEVHLVNGHTLRVRSVISVHSEHVTFEAYRGPRGEGTQPTRWLGVGVPTDHAADTLRAVVSYAAIVAVTIVPPRGEGSARVGFSS